MSLRLSSKSPQSAASPLRRDGELVAADDRGLIVELLKVAAVGMGAGGLALGLLGAQVVALAAHCFSILVAPLSVEVVDSVGTPEECPQSSTLRPSLDDADLVGVRIGDDIGPSVA